MNFIRPLGVNVAELIDLFILHFAIWLCCELFKLFISSYLGKPLRTWHVCADTQDPLLEPLSKPHPESRIYRQSQRLYQTQTRSGPSTVRINPNSLSKIKIKSNHIIILGILNRFEPQSMQHHLKHVQNQSQFRLEKWMFSCQPTPPRVLVSCCAQEWMNLTLTWIKEILNFSPHVVSLKLVVLFLFHSDGSKRESRGQGSEVTLISFWFDDFSQW